VPRAKRAHRVTLVIPPRARLLLEARGATGDQGRGPTAYSRQLARVLEFYEQAVASCDPRRTRRMRKGNFDLVVDVLTAPGLDPFQVSVLGSYLRELPAFRARARERKVDAERLAAEIDSFTFVEKLHLVDAALARHYRGQGG
jgi:hypothetical protein